ncbi:MAG: type I-E CRISPR-associated protein Cse2/CasB [Bellilinea sp.]
MVEKNHQHPFIEHLHSLKDNRSALAALRRGLGQPPGAVPEMFPYVVPYLPGAIRALTDASYYLIASLYAFHPLETSTGNMGAHLRATIKDENAGKATERRFVALLNSHPDDLPVHLRHTVSYLKSKDQPICWEQLFDDLYHWDHPKHYVQRSWANAFWGAGNTRQSASDTTAETAETTE